MLRMINGIWTTNLGIENSLNGCIRELDKSNAEFLISQNTRIGVLFNQEGFKHFHAYSKLQGKKGLAH